MTKTEFQQLIKEAITSISSERFPELEQLSQQYAAGNRFMTILMENGQFKIVLHPKSRIPTELMKKAHITFRLRELVGGLYCDLSV